MPFVRKLTQIGNSKGLILPLPLLEILGWDADTELELQIESWKLIVTSVDRRDATTEGTKTPTPTKKLPKS
jgi:antitoxin component of MazEF toxin-antitoxin module